MVMKRFLSVTALMMAFVIAEIYVYSILNARNAQVDEPQECILKEGKCVNVTEFSR